MKHDIVLIIWNDAVSYDQEDIYEHDLAVGPTMQIGLLIGESDSVLRLCHNHTLDHRASPESDWICIPKSLIVYRKKLGEFDTGSMEVTRYDL
jgi:hypothetical protein